MNQLREDLKSFQSFDWVILTMTTAIFLPHTLCMIVLGCVLAYTCIKQDLWMCIRSLKGKQFIYPFLILGTLVSAFYQNWTGFLMMIGFIALIAYVAYYRQHANSKLLMYIIEWSLILSIIVNILGLFQFDYVSKLGGYSFLDFKIQNSPKRRITGTFQNANIYALMLEYMLACCLYRFLQTKRISLKVWYVVLALFEFAMVILTGCRAALAPLIFVIPVQLFATKHTKLLLTYFIFLLGLAAAIYVRPTLIPRIDDISTIESRVKIWKCGWKMFKDYPIFGNGPWTYQLNYALYHGHKAVHCHNIFLDSLVSFGCVGTILLGGYVVQVCKDVWQTRKKDKALYALMLSILVIICIHGLVDGTLQPIKTDLFAFMILGTIIHPLKSKTQSATM